MLSDQLEHLFNAPFVGFILLIFVYMISFMYLLRPYANSEYLIWILLFILNMIFPLMWMKEVMLFQPVTPGMLGSYLLSYRIGSLLLTFLLTFVGLLLIVLKNDMIRTRKITRLPKNKKKTIDLKTDIMEEESKHKETIPIYINIIAFSLGVVISMFQDYARNEPKEFMVGTSMKSVISFVEWLFQYIDSVLLYYTKPLPFSPLVKCLSVYSVTFIVMLFGLFLRVRDNTSEFNKNLQDPYEVYNMYRLFNNSFVQKIVPIRRAIIFFAILVLALVLALVISFLTYLSGMSSYLDGGPFLKGYTNIFAVVFLATAGFGWIGAYVNQLENQYDVTSITKIIISFICILFGFNATIPVLAILQLFVELFQGSLNTMIPNINVSWLSGLFFLFWFLITFNLYEETKSWGPQFNSKGKETRGELKEMKLILALLVTMTASLFIGLGAVYPMFTILYSCFSSFTMFVLRYLAPLLIILLSIIFLVYSNRCYIIVKSMRGKDFFK